MKIMGLYKNKKVYLLIVLTLFTLTFFSKTYPAPPIPDNIREKLDKRISLNLRDMDVIDVYKFLATKGGFNVIISKDVKGRISLYLKDVSIKDTLDIVSLSANLAYRVMGENIVHIMSAEEYMRVFGENFADERKVEIIRLKYVRPSYVLETLKNLKSEIGRVVIDEDTGSVVIIDTSEKIKSMLEVIDRIDKPLETVIYNLKYANPEEVAEKLRTKLDNKAVGSVQADSRSNQLIVQALPDRVKEVEAIIKSLDKKTEAVLINVRILKLVLNPKFDIGVDWELVLNREDNKGVKSFDFVGSFPIASTISTDSSLGTVGKIMVGNIDYDDFASTLKVLKQISDTKLLANPTIMVLDKQEARIHIGDRLAYVTTTTIGTGESQQVNEEITYVDVGVQFKVTPVINDDGFITMSIKPEISSKSGELTTPQGAKVPLINTTLVETKVIVKDGSTIIIGGLRKDEYSDTEQGIPILMDIPLVGRLFSNQSQSRIKTEIVIFLTPHIISGEENFIDRQKELKEIRPYKEY